MSDKAECVGCNSYTSSILAAFRDGLPCPHCGLSAEVNEEVLAARRRNADAELTQKYEQAVIRSERAEAEAQRLQARLDHIRREVQKALTDDFGSGW